VLETRQLLSTFTVVLNTDDGATVAGVGLTATSGDLRYCIDQVDSAHTAKTDTITFSPKLFATPQTITLDLNTALGPLMLDDSRPLTIKGPAGGTVTVSGGDLVGVFDIPSGKVTISNLAITHGNAQSAGGINNGGTVTLTNCTLDHDSATNSLAGGGGIANNGTAMLTNCTLSNSSASGNGGGIFNNQPGTITLTNCTLSNNAAPSGGGIFNDFGTATLTACTFSNNAANGGNGGGGLCNLGTAALTACTLSNNTASNGGGGIYNFSGATATLTNCTLSHNGADNGGGIYNLGGTVALTACTLSNNTATFGGGIINDAAIIGGSLVNGGTVTLTNCTLSNNAASSSGSGGGIYNSSGDTATLTNCTLSNNAAESGGGIYNFGTLNLTNTLVAENTASFGPDIYGAVTAADHDLIGDGSLSTGISNGGGNQVGGNGNPVIDPRLGPLQKNGGRTQTEALLLGSPAIGKADNAKAPHTDQRGRVRLDEPGEKTDIGAYEA